MIIASVPSDIITCCAVFDGCPWEVCSLLKRSGGGKDLEKKEVGGLGVVEQGETVLGMKYMREEKI